VGDLANLTIWDDPAIRDALSWYLDVAENRRPAKFRIAASVATQLDPPASSEDALWAELDRLRPRHDLLGRMKAGRQVGRDGVHLHRAGAARASRALVKDELACRGFAGPCIA
jgi:hypothetical protein